jgi:Protein of unknown function (DUF3341)
LRTYLIGEFRDPAAAAEAIRMLRAEGASPDALDVFSEEPIEFPRGVLDRPSRMSLVSVAGAVLFGALATVFIWWTQRNYRVVTGGMPVFSFWSTGVITYEMTMLGAIVSTCAWFLRESGLVLKRDRSAPVPQVAPGSLCLRVRCGVEEAVRVGELMRCAGAVGTRQEGGS